jgi:hypothetical protein
MEGTAVDPITLQQILDQLADANGDVADLFASEAGQTTDLTALETEALEAFDALRASDSLSAEDLAALEALADAVEVIRAEQTRREEAAAEQQARVEELAQRVAPPAEGEGAEGDGEGEGEGAEGEGAEGEGAEGTDPAAAPAEGDAAPAADAQPEPVAAAAPPPAPRRRVDLARIARNRPQPAAPAQTQHPAGRLLAASEMPGVPAGGEYPDWDAVTEAAMLRFGALPQRGSATRAQHGILVIAKTTDEALVAPGSDDLEVIEYAASERRLEGGSLVAAGGWCAPSETIYDLCQLEAADGLIDVPEIVAARGGVRWTPGPDFASIYSNVGFLQTEAQAIAATPKTCYEVPCPNFTEARLDAIGVCVSAGILQNRAYPELVRRFLSGAMTAHVHKYNASTIARMVAGSTAAPIAAGLGATSSILAAIDIQANDYRYRHRMADGATLELIAPRWVRGVIRDDLAKRNGVDLMSVTDAMIRAWFAERGVAVQFVYDWQDAFVDAGVGLGGAVPATAWPLEVDLLMYAAGTWVRATTDIISLDAVYDAAMFTINKYNALFSEEGLAVIKRCFDSRVITVPICANGTSGAQVALACPPAP